MNLDWCPGIRDACMHWRDAEMLQQTFDALERTLEQDNDACIDCAKSIVEVFCRIIVDELDSPTHPIKPKASAPDFGEWVGAAVRVLKLGENQNNKFLKLVSQHHKLTTALGDLRNESGPVSHGRDGFLNKLSIHHRRSSILAADALVTFLHQAYLETHLDPVNSREPWERFESFNQLIDEHVRLTLEIDDDGDSTLQILLPSNESLSLNIPISRLLYLLDRDAYIEALIAARGVPVTIADQAKEAGEL
ncbi:abortive infection family protein [Pseudomonas chlororaphis]|nr:abortive infection family protein [Pseudomonas chlororaphis]MBP5142945.1 abortive infection family protein [Pseudomonas chlororaphis]QTT99943.1 abortive infection family protein [Pseudomonas chlororaphis]